MTASIPLQTEAFGTRVLDAAFAVHRALGPGLLESVYEACLCHELSIADVPFQAQVQLPIRYGTIDLESGLRIDLLVGETVIVELKAVESLQPIHEAQLLTYMKLANVRLGFLLNFNSIMMRDGIKRLVL